MRKQPLAGPTSESRPYGRILAALVLCVTLSAIVYSVSAERTPTQTAASATLDTHLFLPAIRTDQVPIVAPIPQVVDEVFLVDSFCPHDVHVNPYNGFVYAPAVGDYNVNGDEHNSVAILKDDQLFATVYTGEWPSHVVSKPGTDLTFMTNLHGNVTVFNKSAIVYELGVTFDPYAVLYNPVNDYVYVSDLHNGLMKIFNGTTYEVVKETFDTGAGDLHEMALNPQTGEVFLANWGLGRVAVIEGTETTDIIQAGWGADFLLYDEATRYLYVSHSAPNAQYPHNISIIRDREVVATFQTAIASLEIAHDPYTGYVYFTNPSDDSVTVLRDGQFVTNIAVGDRPRSMAIDPLTGYVYVANFDGNTVSVIKGTTVVATLPVGDNPSGVAVNPVTHTAYVVNKRFHQERDPFGRTIDVCDDRPSIHIIR
jgi:YVTN family beta-propeller protein